MMSINPSRLRLGELANNSKFICRMNGQEAEAFAADLRDLLSTLDRQQAVSTAASELLSLLRFEGGSWHLASGSLHNHVWPAAVVKLRSALSLLESEPQA
ncbi:MAG TPA: hypothetical protein VFA50_15065 [Stellaceae bacterium]|nr:hypothetical protein [Stellaceae bacterium]